MACECGCGQVPASGDFMPGHDQRYRAETERRAGGITNNRRLVEAAEELKAGTISAERMGELVRELLPD